MKQPNFNNESFENLFQQSISGVKNFEGQIVKGVIIGMDNYYLTVDVGLKSEGKILLSEFRKADGSTPTFEVGSEVEVYIERYEDLSGNIMLSREKAKREEVWHDLEKLYLEGTPITGYIAKRVKGGFAVMIEDTLAFLPGSQLDIRPIKNINSLVGTNQLLQILKMDKKRYNIVVSRKAIISKSYVEGKLEGQEQYEEGQIVEGIIKNITGYGAFIDLGYVDGLLHVTDMSWSRINHPSEVFTEEDLAHLKDPSKQPKPIKLKIVKINPENKRISLGIKQLTEDPWGEVVEKYTIGSTFKVKTTNTTDYGIFVELAKGVEGLVHISEMSWVKKDINPKADYKVGVEVEVKVLDVDIKKRRINLSIKQTTPNPWLEYANANPEGSVVNVEIKETNPNGLVVKLNDTIEGFIRGSDLSWDSSKDKDMLSEYKVGDKLSAKIIKHNLEKDKVLLSVKHLTDDPYMGAFDDLKKGDVVKTKITAVNDNGIEVEVNSGVNGFIKQADLSMDAEDRNIANYKVGDTIEAMVLSVNSSSRLVSLSVKSLELAEQKKNMSTGEAGSSSLADVFAEAMSKKEQESK
ncbi:MAG: 30S ribosomal protein S1 [Alphaproteobacteria bacterium]|jgi:small subunit ribosomal protein S1|nr:30S ribosomal protein S1 [Alphaproteobacteria bacterium]